MNTALLSEMVVL